MVGLAYISGLETSAVPRKVIMAITTGATHLPLPTTSPSGPAGKVADLARTAPAVSAEHVAAVRRDYTELQSDLGRVLENSLGALRDELRATQKNASPLFKSRVLYRAFSKAAGLVERAFQLKTDSLKHRFLKNAPLLVATEHGLAELKLAARELGALNRSLEQGTSAQTAGERVDQVFNRLLQVSESVSRPLAGNVNQQAWAGLTSVMVKLSQCVYSSYQLDEAITRAARVSPGAQLRTAAPDLPPANPTPASPTPAGPASASAATQPRAAGDAASRPVLPDADLVRIMERQAEMEQQLGTYAETFNPLVKGKSKRELAQLDDGYVRGTLEPLRQSEQELSEMRLIVDGQLEARPDNTVLQQLKTAMDFDLALLAEFRSLVSRKKPLPAPDRGGTPDALGAMQAAMRDESTSLKFADIYPDPRFRSAGHFHNQPTPEKPVGSNPLFYREVQEYALCLKHAMNNCLGGDAVTDRDLAESVYNNTLGNFLVVAREQPEDFIQECVGAGFDPAPSLEQVKERGEEYAKQVTDTFFSYLGGPLEYVRNGNEAGQAVNLFNEKREELGIPEARLHNLDTHEQVVGFLERTQQTVDRMIVGTGRHFIAFRKSADGDWFKLDSGGPQQRQTPLEFVQQHGRQESLGAGIRKYDFVVFSQDDFTANIPANAGVDSRLPASQTILPDAAV